MRQKKNKMTTKLIVLVFRHPETERLASLVSDGTKHAVYGYKGRRFVTSIARGLAAIENAGYEYDAEETQKTW